MRHGYGLRRSAKYGVAAKMRSRSHAHASMTSLRSTDLAPNEATIGGSPEDPAARDEASRGGFALRARSEPPSRRRRSLSERSAGMKRSLLAGLRGKKQASASELNHASTRMSTSVDGPRITSTTLRSSQSATSDESGVAGLIPPQEDPVDPEAVEEYVGEWKQDRRSGFGISFRSDGLRYEGEWFNNRKYGYGVTTLPDGRREEGKYKNNVLVLSQKGGGGKRTALFVRAAKLRERVESSVAQAQRAAQMAQQKSDIASARMSTARDRAREADETALHAREDSDFARAEANRLCPDFHQPGPDMLKSRREEYMNAIPTYLDGEVVETAGGAAKVNNQQQLQQRSRPSVTATSAAIPTSAKPPSQLPLQQQKQEPPFSSSGNQLPAKTSPKTPPMVTPPSSFPPPPTSSAPASPQSPSSGPGGGIPVSELATRLSTDGAEASSSAGPFIEPAPPTKGSISRDASKDPIVALPAPSTSTRLRPSGSSRSQLSPDGDYFVPPPDPPELHLEPQPEGIEPQIEAHLSAARDQYHAIQEQQRREMKLASRMGGQESSFAQRPPIIKDPEVLLLPSASRFSLLGDHFDQYIAEGTIPAVPVDPKITAFYEAYHQQQHAAIAAAQQQRQQLLEAQAAAQAKPATSATIFGTGERPLVPQVPPEAFELAGPSNRRLLQEDPVAAAAACVATAPAGIVRRSTLATERDRFGLATAFGVNPSPGAIIRTDRGLDVNPPAIQAVEHIYGRRGIQRTDSKQSLPDEVALVRTPLPLSREEVSRLSSARRLSVRRHIDDEEFFHANPLRYFFHPVVKDWVARKKLLLVVLMVNMSLSLVFYRLLANDPRGGGGGGPPDDALPPLD